MRPLLSVSLRSLLILAVSCASIGASAAAQTTTTQTDTPPAAPQAPATSVPNTPGAPVLQSPQSRRERAEAGEAARKAALPSVNGRPYDQPSNKDQFHDYLRDSYGPIAFGQSVIRSLYSEARGKPSGWGQDFPGYTQRLGSAVAITAINGNVRYGMETVFHEDMNYIPCHGCSVKKKIGNAVLAEFTARHDVNGHRFFTLTPVISDFSGPIIANASWYPNHDPFAGVVATRTVFATRVGAHLFQEFILERRHRDPHLGDDQMRQPGAVTPAPASP
jgi:hypothetical protein